MSTNEVIELMGHNGRRMGVPVPGGEPAGTVVNKSYKVQNIPPGSLKDLILQKTKGGVEPPWACDVRPTHFVDKADPGGAYQSYYSMRDHRTKHVRTTNGPVHRFGDSLKGPPISSMDHGFSITKPPEPPKYPCSSSFITKNWSLILQSTKHTKPR